MLSNVLVITLFIIITLLFSRMGYDYYYKVSEAKQLQQTYETISEIKKILAKQYNKDPNEITRDEIIAILPKGKNWEKLFLSNQNSGNTIDNNAIIDENVNFVLSEDDKLKLLALKSKLKNLNGSVNSVVAVDNKLIYSVSSEEKNRLDSANIIKKEAIKVKSIVSFSGKTLDQIFIDGNYSQNEITQIKDYLKQDLETSKNSLDKTIYMNVKDSL